MNFFKWILLLLFAALFVGAFYVLTLFSPSPVSDDPNAYFADAGEDSEILKQSEILEKEFEERVLKEGVKEGVVNLLRKAVSLQEVYINRSTSRDRAPAERLLRLRSRLQNIEAKPLSEMVADFERKAAKADAADDIDAASSLYSQAYSLQNKINLEYSLSKYKSIEKAMLFDNKSKLMRARPLYNKSVAAENKAREALEKRDWDTAKAEFEKAFQMVSRLNSEFPDTAYTDFSRLQGLDTELESLKSTSLYTKLERTLKSAEEYKAKANFPAAAEAYGDACEIQRSINKIYPRSRHSSEERLKALEREKTDAYSWDYANAIKKLDSKLSEAVAKCDVPLVMDISANLLYKAEQFKKDFPRSELVGDDIILKLRYINFMGRDIPEIAAMVNGNLIDIGGGKKMLKTETTQKLYKMIMKENPSRYSESDMNPVDSVSFDDVGRFCTRLSWVLSAEVSVPTQAEFSAALGSLRYVDINAVSWNNLNSGGRTHIAATKKPNDRGFFDLLGNVEEFVAPDPDSAEVKVMGGSIISSTDSLSRLSVYSVDKNTRKRTLGFRITVKK